MGNLISSLFSGFVEAVGKLFGSPLDFLSGKSCNSVCGSTWDFTCYIENFCIVHLLKLAMVSVLLYIVLLFLYLLYKLGLCQCIGYTLLKMVWACFAIYFSLCEYCCTCLCYKLRKLKHIHKHHKRDNIEEFDMSTSTQEEQGGSVPYGASEYMERRRRRRSSLSYRWRDSKGDRFRRSLRPRSHRVRVGVSGDSVYLSSRKSLKNGDYGSRVHGVRVSRTSKFVQKGTNYRGAIYRRRKW